MSERDNHVGHFFEDSEIARRHRVVGERYAIMELAPLLWQLVARIISDLGVNKFTQRLASEQSVILLCLFAYILTGVE